MGETIYRVPAPKPPVPPDPYLLAWASLRRRRVAMLVSGLGLVPMTGVAIHLGGSSAFIVAALVAFFSVSSLRVTYFRCPHCREALAKTSAGWDILQCANCGIRLGTPRSAVVAEATSDVAPDAESE